MAVLLDGPAGPRRHGRRPRRAAVEVLGGLLRWPVVERVWLPEWLTDPGAVSTGWWSARRIRRRTRSLHRSRAHSAEEPQTGPGTIRLP